MVQWMTYSLLYDARYNFTSRCVYHERFDWRSYSNEVKLVPAGSTKILLPLQQSYYKPRLARIDLHACLVTR